MAQYNIGFLYASGHGVPQDYVTAHMWFNLSAAQDDDDAVTAQPPDYRQQAMCRD
jgi:TPR repeat protein